MIDVKDLTQVTQAPELGTRKNEDSNDALLRQVDEELARLTTPEAHYALNAHVQETLEDVEPLTLQRTLRLIEAKRKDKRNAIEAEATERTNAIEGADTTERTNAVEGAEATEDRTRPKWKRTR